MGTLISVLGFGSIVGLSLGLTGGGGAIFAVPLLVYGLEVSSKEAIAVSLASVGVTALVGFWQRWRIGQVEVRTGLMFAAAGMLGTPIGTWIADRLPDSLLLLLFAVLMLIVAARMWWQARPKTTAAADAAVAALPPDCDGPTCRRDANGSLLLNTPCAILLLDVGLMTGVLTGLFGVGGGFVIVPALVLFSSMSMHRAVGTSLMVVAMVSMAGFATRMWSGQRIPVETTLLFVSGAVAGLMAGHQMAHRLSGPSLQRVFAVAIVLVAAFVIVRNVAF
ncbi:MAG: sulfite exporter TauE/SafE family protein [Pirellulales bacterium]